MIWIFEICLEYVVGFDFTAAFVCWFCWVYVFCWWTVSERYIAFMVEIVLTVDVFLCFCLGDLCCNLCFCLDFWLDLGFVVMLVGFFWWFAIWFCVWFLNFGWLVVVFDLGFWDLSGFALWVVYFCWVFLSLGLVTSIKLWCCCLMRGWYNTFSEWFAWFNGLVWTFVCFFEVYWCFGFAGVLVVGFDIFVVIYLLSFSLYYIVCLCLTLWIVSDCLCFWFDMLFAVVVFWVFSLLTLVGLYADVGYVGLLILNWGLTIWFLNFWWLIVCLICDFEVIFCVWLCSCLVW